MWAEILSVLLTAKTVCLAHDRYSFSMSKWMSGCPGRSSCWKQLLSGPGHVSYFFHIQVCFSWTSLRTTVIIRAFFLNRSPSSVAPPCVKWKERFLRNLSSSLHLSCYLKTVFASRWVLEPKDTSKPNIRRRKDLLLAANKEKRGELSPKQGLSEQQNWGSLKWRVYAWSWGGLSRRQFSTELGQSLLSPSFSWLESRGSSSDQAGVSACT